MFGDECPPAFQRVHPQCHQVVDGGQQPRFVAGVLVAESGTVEGDHPNGAGEFRGAEEPIAAFEELPQVKLEAAAHGADHARVQVGVDEVLEVGETVLRGHVEEGFGVGGVPVEVLGDVVGGDRESEGSAVGVAFGEDCQECPVDEVHFGLEVAVAEVHDFPADDGGVVAEVRRAGPVKGEVSEWGLGAPPGGNVEVKHKLLQHLVHLFEGELVDADEGRHVGVEGAKGLRPGPLVLQST